MPYCLERLEVALSAFDDPARVAVEFRNLRWLTEETKALLSRFNATFCNVDSAQMSIAEWLTSETGYIRLHGRKEMYRYNYNARELQQIADHGKNLMKQGAKKVYIIFNNTYQAFAPVNAEKLLTLL